MPIHAALRPRWIVATCYLMYFVAGFAFSFFSETQLRELLGEIGFVVWNGMLMFGSCISLYGVARNQQWIELIGLPGIVTALTVYGLFLLTRIEESDAPGVLIGFACICGGAALGALGRTYEVWWLARVKTKVTREIHEEREAEE